MFQAHPSWGQMSRKLDLNVVAIIRNGKIIDTDFPEFLRGVEGVETDIIGESTDFEAFLVEQNSGNEEEQDEIKQCLLIFWEGWLSGSIRMNEQSQTFTVPLATKPVSVVIDPDNTVLMRAVQMGK